MNITSSTKRKISTTARYTTLPLLLFGITPLLGHIAGGGIWYWLTIFVIILSIIFDPILGSDPVNASPDDDVVLERKTFFRVMLWLFMPLSFLMTLFCYSLITNTPLQFFTSLGIDYRPLSNVESLGLALSLSLVSGFGATIAHELCHHGNRIDRFIGQLLFTPIGMVDFSVYHNFHHHLNVATPKDHATAPYGENFWYFAIRSTVMKSLAAWQVEAERLERIGASPFSLKNHMIWLTLMPVTWFSFLFYTFGWLTLPLFILQYIFPRMLLATADFAEHYGLMRKKLPDGSYEKVRPEHAWDDSSIISSFYMCQIDRHSDHHANVGRPYQILRVMDKAPRLPYGYLNILFIVMVPPLWRKLMHPIVEEFYDTADIIPYALPNRLPERFVDRAVIAER